MRVCVIGLGRAGMVHLRAIDDVNAREDEPIIKVVSVVDTCGVPDEFLQYRAQRENDAARAVAREDVDLVIVATPTATHHAICKLALSHRKHVMIEKPIATSVDEIQDLYELARKMDRLLFTAYNRRHDPSWRDLVFQLRNEQPLHINVVCRDFPFPPRSYLETCGGIFRDAAVHDYDILCVLLRDVPIRVRTTLDASRETGVTHLTFSRGCEACLVHTRHSTSYDQRVAVFCSETMFEFGDSDGVPAASMSFQNRYRTSYAEQLHEIATQLEREDHRPNVSFELALFMEKLLSACDESAHTGSPVELKSLRSYMAGATRVKEMYRTARMFHTVERERSLRSRYQAGRLGKKTIWSALTHLDEILDLSNSDVETSNAQHALQTAESIRGAGCPEWMQLVGLIHDFGKLLVLRGEAQDGTSKETQWSVVGDTFVVGHPLPSTIVYPEFNACAEQFESIYEPHCGLDNCLISYGHNEYLYQILLASGTRLPEPALKIVRYHSALPLAHARRLR